MTKMQSTATAKSCRPNLSGSRQLENICKGLADVRSFMPEHWIFLGSTVAPWYITARNSAVPISRFKVHHFDGRFNWVVKGSIMFDQEWKFCNPSYHL